MQKLLVLRWCNFLARNKSFCCKNAPELFLKVLDQFRAYRQAYQDMISEEQASLAKLKQDLAGAMQVKSKLERTLPFFEKQAATFDNSARMALPRHYWSKTRSANISKKIRNSKPSTLPSAVPAASHTVECAFTTRPNPAAATIAITSVTAIPTNTSLGN